MTTHQHAMHGVPTVAPPPEKASRIRPLIVGGVLVVLFGSPLSLAFGFLGAELLARAGDFGALELLALFAGPAVLAAILARAAGYRVGLVLLPVLAVVSVAGWGLYFLSQSNFSD